MGTESAGKAFMQFGQQMLASFISTILDAMMMAYIAIPVLEALGILSGGATVAQGAAAAPMFLAAGMASMGGMVGFAEGGLTPGPADEIAGVVHGQEFVMPAGATASIGLPALQQMAESGRSAGSMPPIHINVFGDMAQALNDHLRQNPEAKHIIVNHVKAQMHKISTHP